MMRRLRPREKNEFVQGHTKSSGRGGIRLQVSCLSKSCSLEKPLILLFCFTLASINGWGHLRMWATEKRSRIGWAAPGLTWASQCDCDHVHCCAFGAWVWLWAAVIEMASELDGGWDSPDSTGSSRDCDVYTLEHMYRRMDFALSLL